MRKQLTSEMMQTLIGSFLMGAISTIGDLLWELFIPQHQTHWGILHGILLCFLMGAILGRMSGSWKTAKTFGLWEIGVGAVSAGLFYALWPLMGWSAMFVAWMVLWLMTAWIMDRALRSGEAFKWMALRGVLAAVLSGAVFYLISGIWTDPPPDGPNYPLNFAFWTLAFIPGFAALVLRRCKD